jgi:hypothetical protein
MAKKKPVPKLKKAKKAAPVRLSRTKVLGQPMLNMSIWVFDADPDIIQFHADEICRAFLLHFGVQNFGVKSFGYEEEE